MQLKDVKNSTFRYWLIAWSVIYLIMIIFGLLTPNSPILTCFKVGSIFLCFIYTWLTFPKDRLLQLALLTTFAADIILALNNTSELGILAFLVAQAIHTLRLNGHAAQPPLAIFTGVIIAVMSLNALLLIMPPIYLICLFYIILLITNILVSWQWQLTEPQNPQAWGAFLGFSLFLLCDLCTGISYLALNQAFPTFLYTPANFFAWFFYYPSQIFLSNSSKYAIMNPKKKIVQ